MAGRTYKLGSVDAGTTVTDWMAQERERGITITAAATACSWQGYNVNIIDTPGHVDFTAEVERSLRVLDGGVVIFDAVAGVQPQTETVWRQADKYHVPRIAFVNKMDRTGANFQRTLDMIGLRLRAKAVPVQLPIGDGDEYRGVVDLVAGRAFAFEPGERDMPPEIPIPAEMADVVAQFRDHLLESVAEVDDRLLEKYLDGTPITNEEVRGALRQGTISNALVPVLCGAAYRNMGIAHLLDAVVDYLPSPLDVPAVEGLDPRGGDPVTLHPRLDEPFSALAFKVATDPYIGRLVFIRAYSGTIKAGSIVYNSSKKKRERISRVVRMHAEHREEVPEICAGEIAGIVGLKETFTGETLCVESTPLILEPPTFPEPVIAVSVEPRTRVDQERMDDAMRKLSEEDPTFIVRFDPETGQTVISGMGELHLDILMDRMRREFGVAANVGRPRVAYREAITRSARVEGRFVKQTGGHGQFGHVWLEIDPAEQGSGFVFENKIVGGVIPREYISGVQAGVKEALYTGVIGGYPVVDVKVAVVDGSYHPVDSSEMAFKVAGAMAMKEGLKRAGSVLLEPVMLVEVVTPGEYLGEVLGDLNGRRARIQHLEGQEEIQTIRSLVPLAELFGYATTLRSLTQGRAASTMEFRHYDQVGAGVSQKVLVHA
jgi:elongation factor G